MKVENIILNLYYEKFQEIQNSALYDICKKKYWILIYMEDLQIVNHENNLVENMDLINLNCFNNKCFNNLENFIIKDFKILYDMIKTLNLSIFQENLILVRFRRINLYCMKILNLYLIFTQHLNYL